MTEEHNPATSPAVHAEGVWKRYGAKDVLRGVDMTVPPGSVTCVLGPSGSGKSTLLRCVNGLQPIYAGRLEVHGRPVGSEESSGRRVALSDKAMCHFRRDIGMVFQHFNLFPHMTALENVAEAPIRVSKIPRSAARDRARALLERVGLGEKADAFPGSLSGGQQQRVAIARALAMKPRLMLFDEPTSALDPELIGEVLDVMSELAGQGLTMVVVTHEIGFARAMADQVVFMDEGRVVEAGPADDVLSRSSSQRTKDFLARVMR
jgi:polar amino acid transport system ATP-binding protein